MPLPRSAPPAETPLGDLFADFAQNLKKQVRSPNYLSYHPTEIQLPFHLSMSRRKLFIGGNRAGKTTAGINEGIGWATKRHRWRKEIREWEEPIRGRIICRDNEVLKTVILPQVKQWMPVSDLRNNSWDDSYVLADKTLYLANGSTIQFKTYEQDVNSHAGLSLHWIHFDEPPPKDIYQENLLRLLDAYDDFENSGAFWMTYTPVGGMDWAYQEIYVPGTEDPEGSGIFVLHASVDENPHISEEAKKEIFKGMSEEQIAIRRHGKYIQLSGMVFSEWNDAHVLSPDDVYAMWGDNMLPPSHWKLYWSIDHGLHNATAIYWHAVSPTGEVVTFHERHVAGVVIEDHARAVREYERFALKGRQITRTGDPAMKQRNGITGTSVIQEYAKHEIYIGVENVPRDPSIGIVRMRQYMKLNPKTGKPWWRIYDCPALNKELRQLHWERFASSKMSDSKNPKESVHKYKDHGFDSCKYFFTAVPSLTPEKMMEPDKPKLGPDGSLIQTIVDDIWTHRSDREEIWQVQDDDYGLEEFD